jgi:hypothetical protein
LDSKFGAPKPRPTQNFDSPEAESDELGDRVDLPETRFDHIDEQRTEVLATLRAQHEHDRVRGRPRHRPRTAGAGEAIPVDDAADP